MNVPRRPNAVREVCVAAWSELQNRLFDARARRPRIVVPAALKWEIRDKLDQANITERVLFTGLDGLSRWFEPYYKPRTI